MASRRLRTMALFFVIALAAGLGGCGGDTTGPRIDGGSDDGGGGAGGDGGSAVCEGGSGAGDGTYYDADGSGNCSFDPSPDDLMVGAMNTTDYDGSRACGACVHIKGPQGEVTVRVVDRCPGCAAGDIDLSPQAFAELAPLADGRVPISWQYVPCDVTGPVSYQVKDGSSQYWAAVQVRNTRYAVDTVEARVAGGDWQPLERQLYNYFVAADGLGTDPVDLRITDVHGDAIEETGVVIDAPGSIPGTTQFPACGG